MVMSNDVSKKTETFWDEKIYTKMALKLVKQSVIYKLIRGQTKVMSNRDKFFAEDLS